MVNKDNKDTSDNKGIKVVVSSVKEDDNEGNQQNNNSDNKVGFFKTFYYSTIRLDKLQNSIESSTSWVRYIIILLILLSIILGTFLGIGMLRKVEDLKTQINELPDLTFKEGIIEGDIDVTFFDLNGERLIIINTIDSLFDVRDKYKEDIDKVDQYILLTKDKIYVEPGESLEYAKLNALVDKTITKEDIFDMINSLFQFKFVPYFSGFIASIIILGFIAILAFFIGRFIITILTIYGIKEYDFKKINKMAIFLTTMPFIVYVILIVINLLNILNFKINNFLVFMVIYLVYIVLTIQIIKKNSPGVKVIKNIEDLTEAIGDITEHTMDSLENETRHKKEEKRKLKEKQKKDKKDKEEKEIVEGA